MCPERVDVEESLYRCCQDTHLIVLSSFDLLSRSKGREQVVQTTLGRVWRLRSWAEGQMEAVQCGED